MLNWKIRYSGIIQHHPELLNPNYTVVEVGSGPFGIAQFLRRRVIGVEPNTTFPGNEYLQMVEGTVTNLPFAEGEIDFVVCVDMLEHVLPEHRERAVSELVRVAKQRVIISCPCHRWARGGEQELRETFERRGLDVPGWLQEHLEFGLPLIDDIILPIARTGYKFEVLGNESMLQHYAGILLDWMFPMAGELNEKINAKAPYKSPVLGNDWDLYYSFMFNIYKQHRLAAPGSPDTHNTSMLRRQVVHETAGCRLYAVYHTDFPVDHLGSVSPIFAGEAARSAAVDQLTDRTRSDPLPNRRWSELSAIYKVWSEGPKSAVVGFSHYRRLFDFRREQALARVRQTDIRGEEWSSHAPDFFDEEFLTNLAVDTIIVSIPEPVQRSVFDQYCNVHNTNDYLHVFNQISLSDSPLIEGFLDQFSSDLLYAHNMFITKWDLFCELCEFWFSYLGRFAKEFPDRSDAAYYHNRDVAFLSERIFDAWVRYRKNRGTKIIELPFFFLI